MSLLLLFIAGLVLDALQALFIRCATNKAYLAASGISFLITIIGYGAFYSIIDSLSNGQAETLIAYALGGAAGSWVGLKWKG